MNEHLYMQGNYSIPKSISLQDFHPARVYIYQGSQNSTPIHTNMYLHIIINHVKLRVCLHAAPVHKSLQSSWTRALERIYEVSAAAASGRVHTLHRK